MRRARREPARARKQRSEQDLAVDPVVDHHEFIPDLVVLEPVRAFDLFIVILEPLIAMLVVSHCEQPLGLLGGEREPTPSDIARGYRSFATRPTC